MSQNESDDVRSAAESLFVGIRNNMSSQQHLGGGPIMPTGASFYDIGRAHQSINLITEEFLGGYMEDGRMSVIRRFFCLFVTFDLFFVSLLWLICIMINGDNIFQAFQKQIVHYTIYTSLFDVVAAAIARFLILIIFYALLYINHWFIIAFTTTGSCLFLISKVFVFDWVDSKEQVFEVILIITSFVLSWGEAWFLDCRVIPQERHARRYFSAMSSANRSPMLAPFLASQDINRPPESVANFYSPLDSAHNSDEEDEQDEEYRKMGLDCIQKTYELLESGDWKVEKVTAKGDTIHSTQRDKLGKVYRLTAIIKYPAKELLEELFYRIEAVPQWNPTLLESKIIHKINSYTDITYQASVGGGGGMVKSRDFVNLRCWRLLKNGEICDENIDDNEDNEESDENFDDSLNNSCEGSVSTVSDSEFSGPMQESRYEAQRTRSSFGLPNQMSDEARSQHQSINPFYTLSKSLGAKDFANEPSINRSSTTEVTAPLLDFSEPPPLDDEFQDARGEGKSTKEPTQNTAVALGSGGDKINVKTNKVWISAAISIDYAKLPPTSKYTRGQNLITGFALRETAGQSNACVFEWILCLDLKGYIPRKILDTAYTTFMSDYMKYLRKYVTELRQKRKIMRRR